MKVNELRMNREVLEESLRDLEFRAEWERTQFAHEVAMKVLEYRVRNGLTQTELARRLGMKQPHVARLEAGDHEPSLTTLRRLSQVLGVEFHITPEATSISA